MCIGATNTERVHPHSFGSICRPWRGVDWDLQFPLFPRNLKQMSAFKKGHGSHVRLTRRVWLLEIDIGRNRFVL